MIDVTLPQLGESVSEGTITKWLVREGEYVLKDQPLVEIGTDKADSELPAPSAGRVTKILAKEGDVLPVNAVLCQLDETALGDVKAPPPAPVPAPPSTPAAMVERPATASSGGIENVSSRSVTGGTLATPTARKAALENEVNLDAVQGSGERGRITRDDVLRAAATGNGPAPAVSYQEPTSIVPPPQKIEMPPRPAPVAPAASAPVQTPSTRGNTAALSQLINQSGGFVPPIPGVGYGSFKVPAYKQHDGDKVIPFTRRRRITADHMTYSKFASPHVVTVAEIDLNKVSQLRDAHKDRYKKEGHPLTVLAFVVVAVARALRENMSLNARVLDDAYVIMSDINIGVAVDSPDGLVVPVVRRADELGVRGIVRGIDELAKRARTGKITADDLSGATFSVTNPGLKGNLFGGAIINQPNVGILRMGEIQKRVVVVEGPGGEDLIAIHPVMYAALSYDHRIVDGVAANSFLWRVADILEKGEFEV
ncbi:dihydrolipoamide acetyltransferase family protein [Pendulispora albinea]|uniref:Dihydrolipoamide acetyltransferase component of pyruvate dehydrogenase complex n=1 Tax=Pendulispora albinea TaxID=2741071 RepID=A0ABZ2M470_9BACT